MPHENHGPRRATRTSYVYARSWLLVAAHNRDGMNTGFSSHADAVILDLEDGVLSADKPAARSAVARRLRSGFTAWVRINDADSEYWSADLDEIACLPGLAGLVLAKAERGSQIDVTAARLPEAIPIIALIESAAGLEAASEIANHPRVARLAFGSGDYRRDTGVSADPLAMAYPRSRLTVVSRAAGLPGPIGGPTLPGNTDALESETRSATAVGMTGRLCLRAEHTGPINRLLSPSPTEIDWAKGLLGQAGQKNGLDGSYRPQVARAARVLELAEIYA
ncbi:HpcH/HpaI aldolase/citrate lyase family protein [Nocardia cyriacigeorgica]|uniref:(3S)-malyl-CoA thioesterase n=1 Tax=Nocardia cyriacigeorgica TaxID=135487 RepID=A0A4U8VTZ7_9NOCA|nr:CoA ester lyase [Nocardia cyriacigeorgica]VFA96931.1 (3S)-malyl-CoA thioesterase [Nocardia cyriacigeorgica]